MRLSNRPDKIARQLQQLGLSGIPRTLDCPLARFLENESGQYANVFHGTAWFCPKGDGGEIHERPLTLGEAEFVKRFDSGSYPYLVRS